jgi:methyltransferase
MTTAYLIIALVALQRLIELGLAARNTRVLLRRGALEVGRAHYPLIVLFHGAWLTAIILALPPNPVIHWVPLGGFIVLQGVRLWIIASLGPYWTTRIITMPNAPLVRRGPYRFLRHPNYVVVALEVLALPLVFGEVAVALACAILNLGLLLWRIRTEDHALAPRRQTSAAAE